MSASTQAAQPAVREAGAIALGSGVGGGSSRSTSTFRAVPDFLAVIIDLNPYTWAELERRAQVQGSDVRYTGKGSATNGNGDEGAQAVLKKALDEIRLFLNAHTAMQHGNGLAVYAGGVGMARLLYSTSPLAPASLSRRPNEVVDANTYPAFKILDDQIFAGVHSMMQQMANMDSDDIRAPIGIVSALAQALCHVNRLTASNSPDIRSGTGGVTIPGGRSGGAADDSAALGGYRTRILVLSVTEDASAQYIPIMNSIFAAQKQRVVIDVCKLHGEDTVFLQQASHLTSGVYFRLESTQELLQTLMTTFLPSRSIRHLLNLPTEESVDFRAACFCHRKVVDIGYICSVCLSIFCEPPDKCITCKSKFPRDTLERYRVELRTLPSEAIDVDMVVA